MRMREHVCGISFEEGVTGTEGDQGEMLGQAVSTSASVDNGYSSWASRLMSALSTSSEGGEASARTAEVHTTMIDKG